jgi:sarcosine oxidase subunit gamma
MDSIVRLRLAPLAGLAAPAATGFTLAPLPPASRFVLRARPAAQEAAAAPLGMALPTIACRAATAGDRAALWLGPDEWLLLGPESAGPALASSLASVLAGLPHALVDVSHRQSGLTITGAQAAELLNSACPLDLDPDAFPVGMCTRTVFAKAQITLWRTAPETFRLEAWRSFLPYVWGYLAEAARAISG